MNNGVVSLLILLLVLAGCSSTGQLDSTAASSELVRMTTLPPLQSLTYFNGLKLSVLFHIRSDGTVADVKLLGTERTSEWDRAAADSMRQWRFAATPRDSSPSDRWVRIAVIVQVQEPMLMTVGEIRVDSQQEADSIHALLEGGADFEALSRHLSPGTSIPLGRIIGPVDIAIFPQHVRQELRKLAMNGFTHPIRIDAGFYIYRRMKPDGSRSLPY